MRYLFYEKKIRITVSDLIEMIKEARMGSVITNYDETYIDELFENLKNEVDENDLNVSVSTFKK